MNKASLREWMDAEWVWPTCRQAAMLIYWQNSLKITRSSYGVSEMLSATSHFGFFCSKSIRVPPGGLDGRYHKRRFLWRLEDKKQLASRDECICWSKRRNPPPRTWPLRNVLTCLTHFQAAASPFFFLLHFLIFYLGHRRQRPNWFRPSPPVPRNVKLNKFMKSI